MAVIAGQVVNSGLGSVENVLIGLGLNAFAVDYWPPYESICGAGAQGSLTSQLPVSASNAHAISGQVARQFSDDYYHRIHITPRVLALGNVVSTQIEEIDVWNSYLEPMTLNGIDGTAEGFSIDGPDTFPMVFGARDWDIWEVTVAPDGPPTVDVTVTWDFDDPANDVQLLVTGARIVLWGFQPNWATPILERLVWNTDLLQSDTGAEQRRQNRLAPRRSYEVRFVVEGRERSMADNMMHGWGGKSWAMPVWHDVQVLTGPVSLGATSITCETTGRDFRAGGIAVLRGQAADQAETVEIDTVGPTALTLVRPTLAAWPAATKFYPARSALFAEQPARTRKTDRVEEIAATFLVNETSDWPATSFATTYRSHPVLEQRPDEAQDLTGTFERLLRTLDNGASLPFIVDSADEPFEVREHAWFAAGISEHSALRSVIYALAGRLQSVWVPTHAQDLVLLETTGAASTALTVEHTGYTRFGLGVNGRRDIRIELVNGTAIHRRISAAQELSATREQLSIDTGPGVEISPANVLRISFMALMRGQSDEVEIEHLTDIAGVARARVTLQALRDDVS